MSFLRGMCQGGAVAREMSSGPVPGGPMGRNQQDLLLVLPELAQCSGNYRCISINLNVLEKLYINIYIYIYYLWGSGLVSLLASQAHQHHSHLKKKLVLLAVWAGAKSCWKMKSASLKSWSAEGSMKCSKIYW